jgi:hypothetical protein
MGVTLNRCTYPSLISTTPITLSLPRRITVLRMRPRQRVMALQRLCSPRGLTGECCVVTLDVTSNPFKHLPKRIPVGCSMWGLVGPGVQVGGARWCGHASHGRGNPRASIQRAVIVATAISHKVVAVRTHAMQGHSSRTIPPPPLPPATSRSSLAQPRADSVHGGRVVDLSSIPLALLRTSRFSSPRSSPGAHNST